MTRAAQNRSAQKHLHPQAGRLPIACHPGSPLEFAQQVEEHQNAQEGRLDGEELLKQKSSAAKSDFSSSIRCSTQARWL
jgi:hypothetical protein